MIFVLLCYANCKPSVPVGMFCDHEVISPRTACPGTFIAKSELEMGLSLRKMLMSLNETEDAKKTLAEVTKEAETGIDLSKFSKIIESQLS